MIYLGADHRGFELKQKLFKKLKDEGLAVTDLGNNHLNPNDDYPEFAEKVAEATVGSPGNKGILLCGSGVGVDMVANKIPGVRAALVGDVAVTKQSREHEDINVISLPADILDEQKAWEIIKIFLQTPFTADPRHIRRLEELKEVEDHYAK